MEQKEIIKHLHEALNSVDITFPYRYVLVEAIEALSQPLFSSNLEEAADKYAYSIYPSEGVANIEIYNAFIAGAKWRDAQILKLPDGVKEAAEEYAGLNFDRQMEYKSFWNDVDTFKAGAKWQKAKMLKDNPVIMPVEDFQALIDSHAKRVEADYKEKILEDAVEGMVCATITGTNAISFLSPLPDELNTGDKVKVIVIKED